MKLGSGQLKLWTVAAVAVGSLVFGVVWQIFEDRRTTIERAESDLSQLANNIEASTAAAFHSSELVADHVATMILQSPNVGPQIEQFWVRVLEEQQFLSSIAFVRSDGVMPRAAFRAEDGTIKTNSGPRDLRGQVSLQEYINADGSERRIELPRKSVQVDRWIVPVTRVVRTDAGNVLGVVFIAIALDTFVDLYTSVLPPNIKSATFFHDDGRILFSHPFKEEVIGFSMADSRLFTQKITTSPIGTYQALSPIGQEHRMMSYRVLADWPAVLAIDSALETILSDWKQRALIYSIVVICASLIIVALTRWLSIQIRTDEMTRKTLRISEESLETSQHMAGIGHFDRDIRTGAFNWADNMYRIHGVTPESFDPGRQSFMELVIQDDKERVSKSVHHVNSPPTSGSLECRIRRPDGLVREMAYEWQVIQDSDGTPNRVFGIAQDITDLRETENAIRESEERLRDITECMSDFVWENDKDGVLTHFDSGVHDLGIKVEVGRARGEGVDSEAGGSDWHNMIQAIQARKPYRNLVIPFKDTSNERRWIRISANPRYDKDGTFVGWRGAGSDVTEHRQQSILQSEKSKSDALARLAGGMAHEINNLLQPVVVYSSLGEKEEPEPERTQSHFKKIYAATQQAMSIVKDVLTFAREEQAIPVRVDLGLKLNESLDLISPTLPSTVKLIGPSVVDGIDVEAQANGLHQVLVNLINNAVDATSSGGEIVIEVGTVVLDSTDADHRSVLPGRYGFFSVSDNGPGIAEEKRSQIFDPFFTTKPIGWGTGLGLSVVAGLVKDWGGAVDVERQDGLTVFTVYVPLVAAAKQAAE